MSPGPLSSRYPWDLRVGGQGHCVCVGGLPPCEQGDGVCGRKGVHVPSFMSVFEPSGRHVLGVGPPMPQRMAVCSFFCVFRIKEGT